jgi:hypothetical protein
MDRRGRPKIDVVVGVDRSRSLKFVLSPSNFESASSLSLVVADEA